MAKCKALTGSAVKGLVIIPLKLLRLTFSCNVCPSVFVQQGHSVSEKVKKET